MQRSPLACGNGRVQVQDRFEVCGSDGVDCIGHALIRCQSSPQSPAQQLGYITGWLAGRSAEQPFARLICSAVVLGRHSSLGFQDYSCVRLDAAQWMKLNRGPYCSRAASRCRQLYAVPDAAAAILGLVAECRNMTLHATVVFTVIEKETYQI